MNHRSLPLFLLLLALSALACSLGGRAAAPADRLEDAAATAAAVAVTMEGVAGTAVAAAVPTVQAAAATAVAAAPTLQATAVALITDVPDLAATMAASGGATVADLQERLSAVILDADGGFTLTISESDWNTAQRVRELERLEAGDPPALQNIIFDFAPGEIGLVGTLVRPLQGSLTARARPTIDETGALQLAIHTATFNDVAVPQAILDLAAGTVSNALNDVLAALPGDLQLTDITLTDDAMILQGRRR